MDSPINRTGKSRHQKQSELRKQLAGRSRDSESLTRTPRNTLAESTASESNSDEA